MTPTTLNGHGMTNHKNNPVSNIDAIEFLQWNSRNINRHNLISMSAHRVLSIFGKNTFNAHKFVN